MKVLTGLDPPLADQVTNFRRRHHHTAMVFEAILFLLYVKRSLAPNAKLRFLVIRDGKLLPVTDWRYCPDLMSEKYKQ